MSTKDYQVDESVLRVPAERGVRLIALSLLADAGKSCADLRRHARALGDGDEESDVALHDFRVAVRYLRSWFRTFKPQLRGAVSKRQRQHLAEIAEATGAIRDATVHLEWLRAERRGMGVRQRVGETWLRKRLEAQRTEGAAVAIEAAKEFDGMVDRMERRLSVYRAPVVEREPPLSFGVLLARRISTGSKELNAALAAIRTYADVQEAHHARIAAKRLRYVMEPLKDVVTDGDAIIETLRTLQDALGDLHDVHVFSGAVGAAQEAAEPPARPGLVRLARRLHERGARAYADVARDWLNGAGAPFFRRLRDLAKNVERRASVSAGRDQRTT